MVDKWIKPSIKDIERENRNASEFEYRITGPTQKRPSNWSQALLNPSFKRSLFSFLVKQWRNNEYASMFNGKKVFINECDICYSYKAILGKVICIEEEDMFCNHEEADTRMFHAIISLPPDDTAMIQLFALLGLDVSLSFAIHIIFG